MSEQDDKNKRKTKTLIITLIAIIVVLFVGVVYQFITIKRLQKQLPQNSAVINVVENNYFV